MTRRGKRSIRARVLRELRAAWRSWGKPESSHVIDAVTGEIDLKYGVDELNLPSGTVLRLGNQRLDVEDIIEDKFRERCRELGVDVPTRTEAWSYNVNSFCSSILPVFYFPTNQP